MKNNLRLREIERIVEKRACINKCLAKDIKLSSYLGGNPRKILFYFQFLSN